MPTDPLAPSWFDRLHRLANVSPTTLTGGYRAVAIADATVRCIRPDGNGTAECTTYTHGDADVLNGVPAAAAIAWFVTGDVSFLIDTGVL